MGAFGLRMGGSGGGGPIRPQRTPEQVRSELAKEANQALEAGFKTKLSGVLEDLLSSFNDRNHELISSRIDELKSFIGDDLESAISSLYGGSVAKHTYVDGLSDVDTLFVLKSDDLESETPQRLIEKFRGLIKTRLGASADVTAGQMAVTVNYPDGMELQILPAVSDGTDRVLVPAANGDKWSKIAPKKFQEALTRRNQECGGKLIPAVKLAKAINSTLPESLRLSGYHLESLAVDVFRGYKGPLTTSDMIRTFYAKGKSVVLDPIRDRTGQSVNVDDYLGATGSRERQLRAGVFERIEKRMINATTASSIESWRDIFGPAER